MELCNIPEVKLGVIAVSRSCFPASLSRRRRETLKAAYGGGLYEWPGAVGNGEGGEGGGRGGGGNGGKRGGGGSGERGRL